MYVFSTLLLKYLQQWNTPLNAILDPFMQIETLQH